MNKEIFQGKWEEIKGQLKQQWGKLTDDDLMQIEGNHHQIRGILEQRYGYTKEKVKSALDTFLKL